MLRNLRHTDIVSADPVLGPYVARGEARLLLAGARSAARVFKENAPELEAA